DARDAFVCEDFWGLHMLPTGGRVATTSPRRRAMLLALRPDLQFVPMRGNIDTRLRKWASGEADALVLASAGLDRLGRTEHVHQRFSVDEICPAPGQGALALEMLSSFDHLATRDGAGLHRQTTVEAIRLLNDPQASFATSAERHVLAAMGGGCNLPLGAFCHLVDDRWHLHAMVAAPDGEAVAHVLHKAPGGVPAEDFGQAVAESLRSRGAMELLSGTPQEA
ncbi:MAG TPA: hydroxymethylbilane synthase, partial [Acidobacteriaceae bacterium]|nr:hydroxymethylbilane synthase [Acidobacteriaceae bacterium]